MPLNYLSSFAESDNKLTADVIDQARQLFMAVYSSSYETSKFTNLAELRAHKFLKSGGVDLKRLPPTEDAFRLHLERAAYACIVDKTAHKQIPVLPDPQEYGWNIAGNVFVPRPMRNDSWPKDVFKGTSCLCRKGCQKNCGCSKSSRLCNIGCLCRGNVDTCSRAKLQKELETELASECDSSDEEN